MKYDQKRTILGFTLTKRAWNNVLIYAVLALMFLLYYAMPSGRDALSTDTTTEVMGLIPAEVNLQQIVIDDQVLLRQQDGWRCRQPCSLSARQASGVAEAWLSLTMVESNQSPKAKVVDVYLYFGNDQTARIEVYAEPQLLIRLPQQDRVFEPVDVDIESLLGR